MLSAYKVHRDKKLNKVMVPFSKAFTIQAVFFHPYAELQTAPRGVVGGQVDTHLL